MCDPKDRSLAVGQRLVQVGPSRDLEPRMPVLLQQTVNDMNEVFGLVDPRRRNNLLKSLRKNAVKSALARSASKAGLSICARIPFSGLPRGSGGG